LRTGSGIAYENFDSDGLYVAPGWEPYPDTDNDGLSDVWEASQGFVVGNSDNNGDDDGDGYTNLEEFLNCTNPHQANVPPSS